MTRTDSIATSGGIGGRIRDSLTVAQTRLHSVEARAKAQWLGLPESLQNAFERLVLRLRDSLDLPSREEVSLLVDRLEGLDRKLAAIELERAGQLGSVAEQLAAAQERAERAERAAQEAVEAVRAQAARSEETTKPAAAAGLPAQSSKATRNKSAAKTTSKRRTSKTRSKTPPPSDKSN